MRQKYRLSWIIRIKRYFLIDLSQYQGRHLLSFSRSFILIKVHCPKTSYIGMIEYDINLIYKSNNKHIYIKINHKYCKKVQKVYYLK